MKISRLRHVIITSIIFIIIIACIISVYSSTIEMILADKRDYVYRVVATKDIEVGELITDDNVELVQLQNVELLSNSGMIYKLRKSDNHVESVDETVYNLQKSIEMRKDDDLWAIGKVAKENIYKGELLISQRLGLEDGDN